jgi:hypothetical protein
MAPSPEARFLLWRALHYCASARWLSLARLSLPETAHSGKSPDRAIAFLRLIQARGRQQMPAAVPADVLSSVMNDTAISSVALQVEFAFQNLRLAEQRLLLGDRENAHSHCRQFLHGLLLAAVTVMGKTFSREDEDLLVARAGELPEFLAAQLELRQALDSSSLPGRMIVVLGMHRSGTSALCGLLCQAGFDAPSDLMPADAVNPRGYWESSGLIALNDSFLEELGSRWDALEALPQGWQHGEAAARWRGRVLRHLCHAYAGASAPVIKDPRLCILMSGLSPWLESGALRVEMLLTLRDPFEVARSLEAAQNLPSRDGLRLWLHYVLSAERMSRGWPRLMLHFDSLIHDPHQNLERCLALLAAEQNTAAFEPANSFIDPELQHQHREELEREMCISTRALASTRELALKVFAFLQQVDLKASATTSALDSLNATWRLLSEITSTQQM